MKKSLKNQTAKTLKQTSKKRKLCKDLTVSRRTLSDFIINNLGGIELTQNEIAELQPERQTINYSMFTLNPDEEEEYDF